MKYLIYATLAVALHLEVPSFPMVVLPFLFPPEEVTIIDEPAR